MERKINQKDIPTNYSGVPSNPEHHKLIHNDLISRPCNTCGSEAGEECKKLSKGVHMGRVPDGYDTLHFLIAHLNGETYDPKTFQL